MSDAQLLGSAFDQSPNGMSAIAPDGHWLRINAAYCRMLGFEPAELTGGSFQDVTYPDDLAADREFFANALAGGPAISEREKRYVRKDGSIVWASVRAELIRDESGEPRYFVSHLQDVTERRAAQESRRESDRTLRAVIDHTPAIICVKGRDHRYKLVNREFEQVFGVSRDWIIGRSDDEILSPSRLDETRAKDLLVLDGGQTTQEEETLIRDGQERVLLRTRFPLLDEHGEVHAVCIAATDITEHRLEECAKRERLQCSELVYSALAQDRLILYGQPIIRLATMQTTSIELLIRMRKVGGGEELVGPGEFLPAAERFDLISVIDDWVIDHAIDLAAAGRSVTVNVSAKTISDPRQVERIAQTVLAKPGAARNLVFEITETAVADNVKQRVPSPSACANSDAQSPSTTSASGMERSPISGTYPSTTSKSTYSSCEISSATTPTIRSSRRSSGWRSSSTSKQSPRVSKIRRRSTRSAKWVPTTPRATGSGALRPSSTSSAARNSMAQAARHTPSDHTGTIA